MDVLVGWPGGDWQATAKLAAGLVGTYLFLIWVASVMWAYRDIRGRTRDPASQLIGISIVTALPLLGVPIYMVVRPRGTLREAYDRQLEQEAILSELHSVSTCPQCRRPVEGDWAICAFCSLELKQPCSSCDRLLLNAWRACPYCTQERPRPVEAAPQAGRPGVYEAQPVDLPGPGRPRERGSAAPPPGGPPLAEPVPARPRAAAPDDRPR